MADTTTIHTLADKVRAMMAEESYTRSSLRVSLGSMVSEILLDILAADVGTEPAGLRAARSEAWARYDASRAEAEITDFDESYGL